MDCRVAMTAMMNLGGRDKITDDTHVKLSLRLWSVVKIFRMSRRAILVSDACGFQFGWVRSSICVIVEFGSACEWIVQASCFRTCSGDLQEFRKEGKRLALLRTCREDSSLGSWGRVPSSWLQSKVVTTIEPTTTVFVVCGGACMPCRPFFFVLDVCMRGFPSRWLGGIDVCLHFLFQAARNWKDVHAMRVYAQELKDSSLLRNSLGYFFFVRMRATKLALVQIRDDARSDQNGVVLRWKLRACRARRFSCLEVCECVCVYFPVLVSVGIDGCHRQIVLCIRMACRSPWLKNMFTRSACLCWLTRTTLLLMWPD